MSSRDVQNLKEAKTFEDKVEAVNNRYTNLLDADYIYYNASLYNNTNGDLPAQYQEVRTAPIVDRASDFLLAVTRFNVPVSHIPILQFQDQTYIVSLMYNNTTYSTTLTYVPSGTLSTFTTSPFYGSVYYVQQFLQSFNNGISSCLNTLTTAASITVSTPFMSYDPTDGLFTFHAQASYFGLTTATNPIKVFFNIPLYQLFITFNFFFDTYVSPLNTQLLVQDNGINTINGTINLLQEAVSLGEWNQVQSLVFISTGLPTQPELVGSAQGASSANVQIKFLADFEIPVQNSSSGFSSLANLAYQYNPTQYRWISLRGDTPLYAVDFQVYWLSKNGTLTLLQFEPNTTFTIKLVFRRKTLLTTT